MLAVNYLGTFVFTNLMLPVINKKSGRIINVSSELFKRGKINTDSIFEIENFNGQQVYANSKLLVNYFTYELSRKLEKENIAVNCVHPGVIGTNIFREFPKWFNSVLNLFIAKPKDGAKPIINLATLPEIEKVNGMYFNKFKPDTSYRYNSQISKTIWEKSTEFTALNNKQ